MKGQLRQMSKADKLRRAGMVAWLISTAMTGFWVYNILKASLDNVVVVLVLTVVISAGFQYVISLIESALFDGSLPAPWSADWSWEGSLPWLWSGAIVCLLVDVMMNLGGVSLFTSKLGVTNIGQDQLEMTDEFVTFVAKSATFVIAVLFAVASELLDEFAVYAETGGSKQVTQRAMRMKEAVKQQMELDALLKQASGQGKFAQPEQAKKVPSADQPKKPFTPKADADDELVVHR